MADLDSLLRELDRVLDKRIESQRRKVVEVAHRLTPHLTWDDIVNPDDHPELRHSEAFNYEDGTLSGLIVSQVLLRNRLRELGAGAGAGEDPFFHDTGAIPYRFCPRCGGELESRLLVAHDPERLTCRRCAFVFYLDPKVAAGAILSMNGGIVLARRAIEPRRGTWCFPSGYVDRGEPVEDAAAREVWEEVGLRSAMDRVVGVYSYPGRPVVVVVFAGRILGGALEARQETLEVGTFGPEEIPWADLSFPSTREALQDYLGLVRSSI